MLKSKDLRDFRLGTVATSDHETPLTEGSVSHCQTREQLIFGRRSVRSSLWKLLSSHPSKARQVKKKKNLMECVQSDHVNHENAEVCTVRHTCVYEELQLQR